MSLREQIENIEEEIRAAQWPGKICLIQRDQDYVQLVIPPTNPGPYDLYEVGTIQTIRLNREAIQIPLTGKRAEWMPGICEQSDYHQLWLPNMRRKPRLIEAAKILRNEGHPWRWIRKQKISDLRTQAAMLEEATGSFIVITRFAIHEGTLFTHPECVQEAIFLINRMGPPDYITVTITV
jgi:hypothetical protein